MMNLLPSGQNALRVTLAVLGLAGCLGQPQGYEAGAPCNSEGVCEPGLVCRAGTCVLSRQPLQCTPGVVDPEASPQQRWIRVCPETFIMGSPGPECAAGCTCGREPGECQDPRCGDSGCPGEQPGRGPDEPQHEVVFTGGLLAQATEVTQAQWELMVWQGTPVANPSHFKDEDDSYRRPVENINWYEALAYCNWLSTDSGLTPCYTLQGCEGRPGEGEGLVCSTVALSAGLDSPYACAGYRLPTDAEWEYLARAGAATAFPDGDIVAGGEDCHTEDALDGVGWYCAVADGQTRPVAQGRANVAGLFDMHGNVWEWCWDAAGRVSAAPTIDPVRPPTAGAPIVRGGSWADPAGYCTSSYRSRDSVGPADYNDARGLRPVRSLR